MNNKSKFTLIALIWVLFILPIQGFYTSSEFSQTSHEKLSQIKNSNSKNLTSFWGNIDKYPTLEMAYQELHELANKYPNLVTEFTYGQSVSGRPLQGWRIGTSSNSEAKQKVLITALTHPVEFISGVLARRLSYRLVQSYQREEWLTKLLNKADFWIVPLVNPDGYQTVEENKGWVTHRVARMNKNGVDLNRNFPYIKGSRGNQSNAAKKSPNSSYYMGTHPLSEPETLSLAKLAYREKFHLAVNLHSFGGLTFAPSPHGKQKQQIQAVIEHFKNDLPTFQPSEKYRFEQGLDASLAGEIDGFLLNSIGTVSVTFETSLLNARLLNPLKLFNLFWWANPENIEYWINNDRDALLKTIFLSLKTLKKVRMEAPENIDMIGELKGKQFP